MGHGCTAAEDLARLGGDGEVSCRDRGPAGDDHARAADSMRVGRPAANSAGDARAGRTAGTAPT